MIMDSQAVPVASNDQPRKLLPFEDEFDSEYDYESAEYTYLSMDDIQHALKRHHKLNQTKQHRARRGVDFIRIQPGSDISQLPCTSSECNERTIVLVVPDRRQNSEDEDHQVENRHHRCKSKRGRYKHRHRHHHSGSGDSNDEDLTDDSKEKKKSKKHRSRHHDHGSGDSNQSNDSGDKKKKRKHHHRHRHHHSDEEEDPQTRNPISDCIEYYLRGTRIRGYHGRNYQPPCVLVRSSTTTTESPFEQRNYDIDIRSAFSPSNAK